LNGNLATETGDNWSVFFFECPANEVHRILVDLFRYTRGIKEAKIPHFMMREFAITKRFGISLRVLRNPDDAEAVDSKLVEFFEKESLNYQRDPRGNRHAWIRKGSTNAYWNNKRCVALHQLSDFIVSLAKSNLFSVKDRCHFAHYTINMIGLQEATVTGSNQVSLLDIISGQAPSFQTAQLRRM